MASLVPYFTGFTHCVLDLLERFLSLWMAVFVWVQLNGDLVVVSLDFGVCLLGHSFDKQSEWRDQELVSQIHLIVGCLFCSTDILHGMVSGVSLP